MISSENTTVYRSPTRGRRYLTLNGAINAEARSIILEKYPIEQPCGNDPYEHGDTGYYIVADEPERYNRMHKRLSAYLKTQYK